MKDEKSMSLDKTLESITERDLQALVDDQKAERKTLEYKQTLPGGSDDNRKEFLADVSSFANASGGHLLFGFEEQAGVPQKLVGAQVDDIDGLKLRLENMLRDGLSPRLPRVEIHVVPLASQPGYWVVLLRIQKSWLSPHRVIFKDHGHFYARNSAGKYRLDVTELRTAFELVGTMAERIRDFRAERLSRIGAGEETPAPLEEQTAKLVLHMVPFNAFRSSVSFDLKPLNDPRDYTKGQLLKPLVVWDIEPSSDMRFNLDGIMRSVRWKTPTVTAAYTQVFRNGSIEAVDVSILGVYGEKKIFGGEVYEKRLLEAVKRYMTMQKFLGVDPPFFIMVSFLGMKGYSIYHPRYDRTIQGVSNEIDRGNLILPEIVVENFESDVAEAMKPIFDAVWNAVGERCSPNYDLSGKFTLGN